jgi:alpha-glucosidase
LADDHVRENVAVLETDCGSILHLYKALIELRKKTPQLVRGTYQPAAAEGDLLIYRRENVDGALTIALNLGNAPISIAASSIGTGLAILLSTFLDRRGEDVQGVLELRANEGVILGAAPHAG